MFLYIHIQFVMVACFGTFTKADDLELDGECTLRKTQCKDFKQERWLQLRKSIEIKHRITHQYHSRYSQIRPEAYNIETLHYGDCVRENMNKLIQGIEEKNGGGIRSTTVLVDWQRQRSVDFHGFRLLTVTLFHLCLIAVLF